MAATEPEVPGNAPPAAGGGGCAAAPAVPTTATASAERVAPVATRTSEPAEGRGTISWLFSLQSLHFRFELTGPTRFTRSASMGAKPGGPGGRVDPEDQADGDGHDQRADAGQRPTG